MTGPVEAVLIAGPTASGKSALALDLAQRIGGAVVNVDSMQVYRDLHIITARPSRDEEQVAPHCLYGHVDASVNHSAGHYLRALASELVRLKAAGRVPILTGGTGLYFKAALRGLSAMPTVPDAIREQVRSDAQALESPALHARLASRDPQTAARLQPGDRQRILRALEVLEATGRTLADWQATPGPPLLDPIKVRGAFLVVDRVALKARIDRRFEAMMTAGALDEVARLAARALDPALPALRAHGVPALIAHLKGELSLDEAIARGQADTRAYAKRQHTFFRHQLPELRWVEPDTARRELGQGQ
jgi:tRNA dimethylallyltransferase